MSDVSAQDILDSIPVYQSNKLVSYVYLCALVVLVYRYLITVDEEVKYIWPQPPWKLGKIFFLTTRYSAFIALIPVALRMVPSYANLGINGCSAVFIIAQVAIAINSTSSEASLWLCLYALLEGKPQYFYLMLLMLVGLSIPIYSLQFVYIFSQKSIPRGFLHTYLGFPCEFTLPNPRYRGLHSIGMYISAARAFSKHCTVDYGAEHFTDQLVLVIAVAIVVGLVTLIRRYRLQRNRILSVIKREGGLYLVLTLILKFVIALVGTPDAKIQDRHSILWGLNRVLTNVFAERLLLSLRRVDDPGPREVITSIAFNLPRKDTQGFASSDWPQEKSRDTHECSRTLQVEGSETEVRQRSTPSSEQ